MVKLIEIYPTINYVLLKRESKFQPYIAAWNYCDDGTWGQGHYFSNKEDALEYIGKLLKGKEN